MPHHPATTSRTRGRLAAVAALGAGTALLAAGLPVTGPTAAAPAPPAAGAADRGPGAATTYRGEVHVVRGEDRTPARLEGVVFDDRDRDSRRDPGERGLSAVSVSNGRQVVATDRDGGYSLPVRDNMTVFVVQPRGWQVPTDNDNVAQFFYHHLPEGSPPLQHGGLAPTGPTPVAVNFPLARSAANASSEQSCVMAGDLQTYTEQEVGYAAAGAMGDLARRRDYASCGALFVGDVVGDDLSLFSRVRDLTSELNGPVRFLPGNHDLDFDSPEAEHNFDTFRSEFGPTYYSYDVGRAHVVSLQTVEYPTVVPPRKSSYRGALDADQLAWLRNDLAQVPRNRLVVLAGHIPLLEFWYSPTHRLRQLERLYRLLEGRRVVSVSGHTHMVETLREGDLMAGWRDIVGDAGLPFDHLVAGAISGHWFSGRVLPEGFPTAIMRDGAHPGVLTLDLQGSRYEERYQVRGEDPSFQMALGLNTPRYRRWFEEHVSGARTNARSLAVREDGQAGDYPDPLVVSRADLADRTWLTTNVWLGATGTTVGVRLDGGRRVEATRTQPMRGEGLRIGAEWSDPTANQETLVHGGGVMDRSMHLWRYELPADLAPGEHTAVVTTTDVHGRRSTEQLTFEVTR